MLSNTNKLFMRSGYYADCSYAECHYAEMSWCQSAHSEIFSTFNAKVINKILSKQASLFCVHSDLSRCCFVCMLD